MRQSYWREFPTPIILSVSGRDAERYLHSRLSNDIKILKAGSGCFAGCLTAQGRTEALFAVYRRATEDFLIICDGGEHEAVLSAFRRFIVADRVKVEDLSKQMSLLHLVVNQAELAKVIESAPGAEQFSHLAQNLGLVVNRSRIDQNGVDLIFPMAERENWLQKFSAIKAAALSDDEYLLRRIKSGLPSFPEELNADAIFLESGLKSAISFTKGCYVGQEVMERLDSMGKAPRRLWSAEIEAKSVAAKTEVINTSGEKVGVVVSSAYDSSISKTRAFLYLRNRPENNVESYTCAGAKIGSLTLIER